MCAPASAFSELVVGYPSKVSEVRVGRTQFDYSYQVPLTNTGSIQAQCISGTVSSSSSTTVVTEGGISFPNLAPGATVSSSDTFTIRQERTVPFDPAALNYAIKATYLDVTDIVQVSKKRVSRTEFEYNYQARVTNGGAAVSSAVAKLTSTSPHTVVVDGKLTIGNIPANSTITTQDTFTIRQDRAYAFDPTALVWAFPCESIVTQNSPPSIMSTPVTSGAESELYTYDVIANDPDQDTLQFSLTEAPTGMTIDTTTGHISWTPAPYQDGLRHVAVQVSDGRGGIDTQEFDINVSTSVDRIAPVVTLHAPSSAQINSSITVNVEALDNVGVTRVRFLADGVQVSESTEAPYTLTYNAPPTAGQYLEIRAIAEDSAGNQGEAQARILAIEEPDTTPPTIDSIYAPTSATRGERVTVGANVTDNRGVASVVFQRGDIILGEDSVSPYEVAFDIPDDIGVEEQITVRVVATDTSGNTAEGQGTITIRASPDTTSPSSVTISAPATSIAGQAISLAASAVDDTGVLKVIFLANGIPVGEDLDAPYAIDFPVTGDQPAGSQFTFIARALDFSGNATDSDPAMTEIVAPAVAPVQGEVYDDSRGAPLVGVTVTVVRAAGRDLTPPQTVQTNAQGQYRLELGEGDAALVYHRAGYTQAFRSIGISRGTVNVPLDVRLQRLGTGRQINPLAETTINAGDGAVATVAAGSFADANTLYLTKLTGQSLPAPLPLGWAPVAAYEFGPVDSHPFSQVHVSLPVSLGSRDIVGVWDSESGQWRRIDASSADGRTQLALVSGGAFAIARPDSRPTVPSIPTVGQALTPVSAVAIPENASAQILPAPEILFLQPGAKSTVTAAVSGNGTLPSGTPIKVDFSEYYEKTDDARLIPPANSQDMLLYQTTNGFAADFVASPSQSFDPTLLRRGVIRLAASTVGDADGRAVIGSAGGTITTSEGVSLVVPIGALGTPTPVRVSSLGGMPASISSDSRFDFIAGVNVDFGGVTPSAAVSLSVRVPDSITSPERMFWVRPVQVGDSAGMLLVGLATLSDGQVALTAGDNGLPLSLVDEEGAYYLLRSHEAFGFVTGNVTGITEQALVTVGDLPIVGRASIGMPSYAALGLVGSTTVNAVESSTDASASASTNIAQANATHIQNLTLAAGTLTVISVSPADGATGVAPGTAVTVQFSQPIDQASVDSATFTLTGTAGQVSGAVRVSSDGRSAVFAPATPLNDDGSLYTVNVSSTVRAATAGSLVGNTADGSYTSSFNAIDRTAPAMPEPGLVQTTFTAIDTIAITGNAGAAAPGTIVIARNNITGETTSVVAGSDGSFSLTLNLLPGQLLQLTFGDDSGNRTNIETSVPVVLSDAKPTPESILFFEEEQVQQVGVIATYSDGSSAALAASDLLISVDDPSIVAVGTDGAVHPLSDGQTNINIVVGVVPFQHSVQIPVSVQTQGQTVFEGELTSTGADITTSDGVEISIPDGALTADTPITVTRLVLPEGYSIVSNGEQIPVYAAYRFDPDITFNQPIDISFPLSNIQVPTDTHVAVYVVRNSDFSDIQLDGLESEDLESVPQAFDSLNRRVLVTTDHFSLRVLSPVGDRLRHTTTESNFNDNALTFKVSRLVGPLARGARLTDTATGLPYDAVRSRPIDDLRNVVWHATHYALPISFNLRLTQAGYGQRFRISVSGEPEDVRLADNHLGHDTKLQGPATITAPSVPNDCRNENGVFTCVSIPVTVVTNSALKVMLSIGGTCASQISLDVDLEEHINGAEWNVGIPNNQCISSVVAKIGKPVPQLNQVDQLAKAPGFVCPKGVNGALDKEDTTICRVCPSGTNVSLDPRNQTRCLVCPAGQSDPSQPGRCLVAKESVASTTMPSVPQYGDKFSTAQAIVTSAGTIYELYKPDEVVPHAPGANSRSVGIEMTNTGHSLDLYTGPLVDGVLLLTDGYLGLPGSAFKRVSGNRSYSPIQNSLQYVQGSESPVASTANGTVDKIDVVTHRQVDRDLNGNPAGNANGTRFRKSDPSQHVSVVLETNSPYRGRNLMQFPLEAMLVGLEYDFPGVIDTRGGDLSGAGMGGSQAGNGGDVVIAYGVRPEQPADRCTNSNFAIYCADMNVGLFAGLTSSDISAESFELPDPFGVQTDQVITQRIQAASDHIGNLIVRGTLELDRDTQLRISGLLYVAPEGRIVVRRADRSGGNLTILSAGPVIIHGAIDLSGVDSTAAASAGNGGQLVILSRAVSPLQIPTIITSGGDVGIGDSVAGTAANGGNGGHVYIQGAPNGQIIFSGIKDNPAGNLTCNYPQGLPEDSKPGLIFPVDFIPQEAHYYNSSIGKDALCPRVPTYSPNFGLGPTSGRGIVTSGGMGASWVSSLAGFRLAGGNGGDGGNISISFAGNEGVLRFRNVALITGGGTGFVRRDQTIATVWGTPIPVFDPDTQLSTLTFEPAPATTNVYGQITGGSGGAGLKGSFSQFGGNGGTGGRAGNIFIEPAAKLAVGNTSATLDGDVSYCSGSREIAGHDRGIPFIVDDSWPEQGFKSDAAEAIGRRISICREGETSAPLLTFILNYQLGSDTQAAVRRLNDSCKPSTSSAGSNCLLGGSGGLAGGSLADGRNFPTRLLFSNTGTAGNFGAAGPAGGLTVPGKIATLLSRGLP